MKMLLSGPEVGADQSPGDRDDRCQRLRLELCANVEPLLVAAESTRGKHRDEQHADQTADDQSSGNDLERKQQ
jgi:hypothetical protein